MSDKHENGTERLCRALYGRRPIPTDYLGGSEAKMLHEAAETIVELREEMEGIERCLSQWRACAAALAKVAHQVPFFAVPHGTGPIERVYYKQQAADALAEFARLNACGAAAGDGRPPAEADFDRAAGPELSGSGISSRLAKELTDERVYALRIAFSGGRWAAQLEMAPGLMFMHGLPADTLSRALGNLEALMFPNVPDEVRRGAAAGDGRPPGEADFDRLAGCVDGGDRSAVRELFEAVGEWLVADQPTSPASRRVWRAYEAMSGRMGEEERLKAEGKMQKDGGAQ